MVFTKTTRQREKYISNVFLEGIEGGGGATEVEEEELSEEVEEDEGIGATLVDELDVVEELEGTAATGISTTGLKYENLKLTF